MEGYIELRVPTYLIDIFNQAFDVQYDNFKVYVRQGIRPSDAELWKLLIQTHTEGDDYYDDDGESDEEEDEVRSKKITWH